MTTRALAVAAARRRRWWRRVVLPVLRRWQLHAELWSTSSPPPLRSPSGDERHTAPGCGCGCGRGCGCATATATAAAIAMLHSDLPAPAPVAALATPPRRARGPPSAAPPRRCRSPPPCLSPPLPGRCHPRLLDKNRRGIGKSQSKWTAHTMETPSHRRSTRRCRSGWFRAAPRPCRAGAIARSIARQEQAWHG